MTKTSVLRGTRSRTSISRAVDESTLDESAARAAREIEADATSPNTERSAKTALRYWTAWYQLRFGRRTLPMPVPAKVILKFIVDHGLRKSRDEPGVLKNEMPKSVDRALVAHGVKKEGPLSLATILQRVSMVGRLNRAHLSAGQPNPVAAPEVRHLLAALRNAYAKRSDDDPNQRPALTFEPLGLLLAELADDLDDPSSLWKYRRALRDRAMLLFAFASGGRRRSEVTAATVQRLKRQPNGNYNYRLGATKADGSKVDKAKKEKPLNADAAQAMTAWLREAQLRSGPIFRRITKSGRITGDALTPASVRNLVKRLSAAAGLEDGYSAHSLRSGFLTEAFTQGIPMPEAMALSGHKSVQSAVRYYRIRNVQDSPAASLIEGITKVKIQRTRR